jgi:type IV secretory pathway TrbF-like protein
MNNLENPYLNNRKDWNEIYAKEKSNASMWRMFGFINMFITLISVIGVIYIAQLPSVVPYLFKEDAMGGITALGIPNTIMKVDNRIIANQLATFVTNLRQVPSSDDIRKTYVHRVKMMSTSELFQRNLAPMLKDEYALIGTGTLDINITAILPISQGLWEIEWFETRNGAKIGKFKSTISYKRLNTLAKDPNELIWNPIGIIITDISISPEIGV